MKYLGCDVVEVRPFEGHDGRSGARLERVRLEDGRALVVKTATADSDLTVRLTGAQRERLLWSAGTLDRLPAGVSHPILDVYEEGDATVTVMRDLGDAVPGWTRVLDADECGRVVQALTGIHAAFLDDVPSDLCPLETRLTLLSPQTMGEAVGQIPVAWRRRCGTRRRPCCTRTSGW